MGAMFEQRIFEALRRLGDTRQIPTRVRLWNGREIDLGSPVRVSITLKSPRAARYFLPPSLASLGEAYVEGLIDVDGPVRDMIEVAENLSRSSSNASSRGRLPGWFSRHTRSTDREAIAHHYDVSNDFYAAWLDPRMVYSCAYFRDGTESLEAAQLQKLDHICRKLRLEPGMRLLDIGCGWGGLAMHAAGRFGARVVGVTLSERQAALAREHVDRAGLSGQVEIRVQDYRDVPGEGVFERIASIGMFEHVGLRQLPEYFRVGYRLLRPGGVALYHGITSTDVDDRWVGLGGGEFIDRYVFPDGELPHVATAIRTLSAAGFELADAESLRRHYARTLALWSDAFEARLPLLTRLAGPRRVRVWRVYLAGCSHAFGRGWVNIYQLLAARPDEAGRVPLPMTRDWMYPR